MEQIATKISKKNVLYWSLYDFAKAIPVITFALYFSQWLVVQNKIADIWYNLIFVGASVLLLLTAPVLAALADKAQHSLPFLRTMALLFFCCTLSTGLFAVFDYNNRMFVLLACLTFLLSTYFYQFSLIFYNGFLNQLAPPQKQGLISGIGYAANWLGQISGVIIALPFAAGSIYWLGHPGKTQVFIPATLLFLVFSFPMLVLFKEVSRQILPRISLKTEYKNFIKDFVALCRVHGVGRFLLAFFFFNDAIITVENNFAIYLQQVFHVDDKIKSLLLLSVLVTTTLGAFLSGWIADKIGLKKSLLIILVALMILFPALGLANNFLLFCALSVAMGFFYGSSLTVARAVLNFLAPSSQINYTFSYYSLMERFATLIGPVAWGFTILILSRYGLWGYKIAIIVMGLFILLGTIIAAKIPTDKPKLTDKYYGTASQ